MMTGQYSSSEFSRTKTISITSGKGGVGKSTMVSNLAIHFAQKGHKTLIFDGDLGMANIDIMFGVKPKYNVQNVLLGERSMDEILIEIHPNIHLIPGGSGIYELQNLDFLQKQAIMDQVNGLGHYDYLIIDTAPGIDDSVLYLNSAVEDIVVIVTPDPSSITDAYALIKVLNQRQRESQFNIICNLVRDERESLQVYRRLSDVADRFLTVKLNYKGFVPLDPSLRKATKSQQLILNSQPRSPSGFAIQHIGEKLNHIRDLSEPKGGLQFFWQQLVGMA